MDGEKKTSAFPLLWGGIAALLLLLLPRLAVFFASDIAGLLSAQAEEVLAQWKNAAVRVPVYLAVLTGLVLFFWQCLYRKLGRKKGKSGGRAFVFVLTAVLYFLVCLTAGLLLTRVNGIPLHTVLKVVTGLL